MTNRELALYGLCGVWVAANLVVHLRTKDDYEWEMKPFYHKADGVTKFIFMWSTILFWTIPMTIKEWWDTRDRDVE